MKKLKEITKKLIQDESGQGTTEYVLLLVVLVALAMMFRKQITDIVGSKIDQVGADIRGFGSN